MATIDLTFEGESPDAVSVVALTRADTGATVAGVTLPAAMTEAADGGWVFTFAEPAEGLHYDFTYRVTWSDGSTSDAAGSITGAAESTYSTDADVDNAYGSANVTAWADLNDNADATEIAARKAWARGVAYRWINSKIRGASLTAPATSLNFSEFDLLPDIEAERAGAILYQSRGVNDRQQASGDTDGVMQAHFEHAEAELDRVIGVVTATANTDDTTAGQDGIGVITATGCPTTRACCDLPVVIW